MLPPPVLEKICLGLKRALLQFLWVYNFHLEKNDYLDRVEMANT